MTGLPSIGDVVHVRPLPGLRVLEGPAASSRALPPEGREVTWSAWWHRRLLDGDVLLHDPRGARPALER
jgi:hypothetical protein